MLSRRIVCAILRASAVLAFGFCFVAGAWLLREIHLGGGSDALTMAVGLYFIGKAFFVGPMLWAVSFQFAGGDERGLH